jgi:outer membrane biosynthesis protein TonB
MPVSSPVRPGSNWLYKQQDLLLGPVPFEALVEKLYSGEIDDSTPISPHGGSLEFRPLSEYEAFRVHLAKAHAKLKVEAQQQQKQKGERRLGLIKLVAISAVTLVLVFIGGRLASWLAIHRPWEERIQRAEPQITEELPTISLASQRAGEDELSYPGEIQAGPGKKPTAIAARPDLPAGKKTPVAAPGKPTPGVAARIPDGDDVQLQQSWDQDAINRVLGANKASLHRCLTAEAQRQKPGWSARVPIEFTIGNNGRVTKLWIDNPDFKDEQTELFVCMLAELRKWKFPPYEGEQANVSLAFQIQAR